MADNPTAGRRPGARALLAGAAALAPALLVVPQAQAQQGGGIGGIFGRDLAPASPFVTPGDSTRFWLPQLYPDGPLAEGGVPPVWSIRGSLDVLGAVTDNARNTSTNRQADFYTVIAPQVTVAADTMRLVGALSYRPSLRLYASADDQNRVDQNFAGQATATLIEDHLFVDASGYADARSVFGDFGGFGQNQNSTFGRQNRVQATTYRISPYVQYRFGGFATGRLGYGFSQYYDNGNNAFLPGQLRPFYTPQDYTSHEVYGRLTSGEDWDRLSWDLLLSRVEYDGSGAFDGAHRNMYVLSTSYQLTREYALLGEVGWQDEHYRGVPPVNIEDPVWSIGIRWTPDEDSFLNVRYGQRDGFESFNVDGAMSVGVRTRLAVGYREEIGAPFARPGTTGEYSVRPGFRVDEFGNVVDAVTGVPVSLTDAQLLSYQSNISRRRYGSIALSQAWPRDVVTVAFTHSETEPVSVVPGTFAFAEKTNAISAVWTRELEPGLSVTTAGRFGISEQQGGQEQTFTYGQATLTRIISPRLSASLQYQLYYREADNRGGGSVVSNTFMVSLRQLF